MQYELVAKFEGRRANENVLPAYEGSQSIYGIARSSVIVLNYLAEGKVRRRDYSFDG